MNTNYLKLDRARLTDWLTLHSLTMLRQMKRAITEPSTVEMQRMKTPWARVLYSTMSPSGRVRLAVLELFILVLVLSDQTWEWAHWVWNPNYSLLSLPPYFLSQHPRTAQLYRARWEPRPESRLHPPPPLRCEHPEQPRCGEARPGLRQRISWLGIPQCQPLPTTQHSHLPPYQLSASETPAWSWEIITCLCCGLQDTERWRRADGWQRRT